MEEKSLDRRIRRTRRTLRSTLLKLVQEQDFDSITITAITDAAELRRATFYLHYATKEELLANALQEVLAPMLAVENPSDVARHLFEHAVPHAVLYRAVLRGSGAPMLLNQVSAYLADTLYRRLAQQIDGSPLPAEALAQHIAGGQVALWVWWLQADMPQPPAQMAQLANSLVLDGLRHWKPMPQRP